MYSAIISVLPPPPIGRTVRIPETTISEPPHGGATNPLRSGVLARRKLLEPDLENFPVGPIGNSDLMNISEGQAGSLAQISPFSSAPALRPSSLTILISTPRCNQLAPATKLLHICAIMSIAAVKHCNGRRRKAANDLATSNPLKALKFSQDEHVHSFCGCRDPSDLRHRPLFECLHPGSVPLSRAAA
jgi:hypothetical protein